MMIKELSNGKPDDNQRIID